MRHKFNAVRVEHDGFKFDSKAEGRYYQQLKLRQAAGEVIDWLLQVPFHFPGGTSYVVDFMIFESDGRVRFVDVKGMETPKFKADMKRMAVYYPWAQVEIVPARSV